MPALGRRRPVDLDVVDEHAPRRPDDAEALERERVDRAGRACACRRRRSRRRPRRSRRSGSIARQRGSHSRTLFVQQRHAQPARAQRRGSSSNSGVVRCEVPEVALGEAVQRDARRPVSVSATSSRSRNSRLGDRAALELEQRDARRRARRPRCHRAGRAPRAATPALSWTAANEPRQRRGQHAAEVARRPRGRSRGSASARRRTS